MLGWAAWCCLDEGVAGLAKTSSPHLQSSSCLNSEAQLPPSAGWAQFYAPGVSFSSQGSSRDLWDSSALQLPTDQDNDFSSVVPPAPAGLPSTSCIWADSTGSFHMFMEEVDWLRAFPPEQPDTLQPLRMLPGNMGFTPSQEDLGWHLR